MSSVLRGPFADESVHPKSLRLLLQEGQPWCNKRSPPGSAELAASLNALYFYPVVEQQLALELNRG